MLQLASGRPSALVAWNNNYGDDPDKCVFFHCGNWAKAFLPDITIATAPILGEGQFTDDPLSTFGTRAVVRVPELQKLMRFICRNGFEHHAAMNASHCAGVLAEAMDTYLGWEVHRHA